MLCFDKHKKELWRPICINCVENYCSDDVCSKSTKMYSKVCKTQSRQRIRRSFTAKFLMSLCVQWHCSTTTRQCYSPTTLLHKPLAVPNTVMATEAWLSGHYSWRCGWNYLRRCHEVIQTSADSKQLMAVDDIKPRATCSASFSYNVFKFSLICVASCYSFKHAVNSSHIYWSSNSLCNQDQWSAMFSYTVVF